MNPQLIAPQFQSKPAQRIAFDIGLFGFGCIGQGLWGVLNETQGVTGRIARICVRQPDKARPLDGHHFIFDADQLLSSELPVVVELIDRADDAWDIVREALKRGKSVVSANKKMIAEHFEELIALQSETGAALLYEGSACGSIPIIRNLEEYYDNDALTDLTAICNGTTNYILSRMYREGSEFSQVLADAQRLGFAESDPTLDIDGWDAKYKLLILTGHAFGLILRPEDILNIGIRQVGAADLAFAREKGLKIQLLARSYRRADGQVVSYVLPAFIDSSHPFFYVQDEFNAVSLTAAFAERQLFVGKGAGGYPTAAAVLSDLSALNHGYRYEYKKYQQDGQAQQASDELLRVFFRFGTSNPFVESVEFDRIYIQYQSQGYNYLIGDLRLSHIFSLQDRFRSESVLLALWPYD